MQQYVSDYRVTAEIPPGNYHFTGNSVGNKRVARKLASVDTGEIVEAD